MPEPSPARPPFIGRRPELERLLAALAAARQGHGSLVVLAGGAGIGKTRLADALAAAATSSGVAVRWGRCHDGGGAPPFWPWLPVLRRQIAAGEPAAVQQQFAPVAASVVALLPELRGVLSDAAESVEDPSSARFQLLAALAGFLCQSASSPGLLLILEDLQWADPSSLLLLRCLAEELADVPLLVLATYRDAEVDAAHPLTEALLAVTRLPHAERLFLDGLAEPEVVELFEAVGGVRAEPGLTTAVVHETAGNPFFVVELARLLASGGQLWHTDAVEGRHLAVPRSVQEVIARRLAPLSPECRGLLALAAVLGEEFGLAALEAASELASEALWQALAEAEQVHLVVAVPGVVGRYRFDHGLTRETIADGVGGAARVRLHARVGTALEQLWGHDLESHLGELAHHFRQAAPLGHAARAVDYLARAAAQAARLLAYEDAAGYCEAALALLDEYGGEPQRRAQVLERLGEALLLGRYDWPGGISRLEAALALYKELGLDGCAAAVHLRLGRYLSAMPGVQDLPRAIAHFRAAEALFGRDDTPPVAGPLVLGLAQASIYALQLAEAKHHAHIALQIGRQYADVATEAEAMTWYGAGLALGGGLAEGRRLVSDAWRLADRANASQAAFNAAGFRAAIDLFGGDPSAATAWYQRELDRPRSAQVPTQHLVFLMMSAVSLTEMGDLNEARRRLHEALSGRVTPPPWFPGSWVASLAAGDFSAAAERVTAFARVSEQAGDRLTECLALTHLVPLVEAQGEPKRAEESLRRALDLATSGGDLRAQLEMNCRPQLARLCAASGQLDEAQQQLTRCRDILAAGEDWRGLAGRVTLAEGTLATAAGRARDAEGNFALALERLQRYHLVWDEAALLLAWGRALAMAGDTERAAAQFAAAQALYRRIGAGQPWLDRADRLQQEALERAPLASRPLDRLTVREREVLQWIARGCSNAEIATALVVSVHTVERHVANIYAKLGLSGRAEAIALAVRHGLD